MWCEDKGLSNQSELATLASVIHMKVARKILRAWDFI